MGMHRDQQAKDLQSADITGLSADKPDSYVVPIGSRERPQSLAWISDDLLRHTREVWTKAYGRLVSEEEAIEVLLNVKRLAEVVLKIAGEEGGVEDECCDLGTGIDP
jgi:hypothetical protein